MCPPCLKMVTDINSWSRSWSLYPRTCSGWVDWSPILWTSCQNISSNGILKKVSVLAQHLPFRLFKNNRLTKKHKCYSNFDCSIAHGPHELFLLNDWLFQVPRKNTWCENQRARGLFFFPTTAPFPSRSGASYFWAACFCDLPSRLSESLAQAEQMTFPKLENGDNIAKKKKVITHYYWCWLPGKNSYSAQKKLNLRASVFV